MTTYCVVCGKVFVPHHKVKNGVCMVCKNCGWSQLDAIFRNRDKYDAQTGEKK